MTDLDTAIRSIVRDELRAAGLTQMPKALTVRQVAEMAACDPITVRRAIERGELPVVRLGSKAIRVPADAVRTWLSPTS